MMMRKLAFVVGGVAAGGLAALLTFGVAGSRAQQTKPASDSIRAPVIGASDSGSLKGPRQPVQDSVPVLPLLGDGIARAGHPIGADLHGLSSGNRRAGQLASGGDQEGAAGLDREEAGRMDPGPLPAATRALSSPAPHQGAGTQRLWHLSRRGPAHAAGV